MDSSKSGWARVSPATYTVRLGINELLERLRITVWRENCDQSLNWTYVQQLGKRDSQWEHEDETERDLN